MFSEAELKGFINELSEGKHSYQNCERLAAVYTVMDHLYSNDDGIGDYGESEFLQSIKGKDEREVFCLLDELLHIISAMNPRLYDSLIAKIEGII